MLSVQYTLTLHDVLELYPEFLSVIDDTGFDNLEADELKKAIVAMWDIYEISGETIPEAQLFIKRKFEQYASEYDAMLGIYTTEVEWIKGRKFSESIEDSSSRESTTTPGVVNTSEGYDLPRSTANENRPSNKTVTTPSGENEYEESNSYGRTRNTHDGDELEQRNKALKAVRNLYKDFAEKFSPCFIDMFS